jgi:hypothetical protein
MNCMLLLHTDSQIFYLIFHIFPLQLTLLQVTKLLELSFHEKLSILTSLTFQLKILDDIPGLNNYISATTTYV